MSLYPLVYFRSLPLSKIIGEKFATSVIFEISKDEEANLFGHQTNQKSYLVKEGKKCSCKDCKDD